MLPNHRLLRAALVGATAAVTVAAGVTALVAPTASAQEAGTATVLRLESLYPEDSDNSASAGTCRIFRLTPTTSLGQTASDSGTVVINLNENPESDSQDVDFCVPPPAPDGQSGGSSTLDYGKYRNALPSAGSTSTGQTYCAGKVTNGRSITPPVEPNCSQAANTPDRASGQTVPEQQQSTPTQTTPQADTNPTGTDFVDDLRYDNDPATATQPVIEFGVVGLVPGGASIEAFIDRDLGGRNDRDSSEPFTTRAITFTTGGAPASVEAFNAVTTITSERTSYTAVQNPPTPARIDLELLNNQTDTVFGVTPNYRVQSGPNASSTINSCPPSDNFGDTRCSYTGPIAGTDTLLIWVNHSAAPNSTATAGPDPGEPTRQLTVTTFAQAAPPSAARFIDLTPNSPTSTTAGDSRTFSAAVTDAGGAPAAGVSVTFQETGPGQLVGGTSPDGNNSTLVVNTGPDGVARATVMTRPGESGTQTVTASISSSTTDCGRIFNGSTGTCSDSTTNTVGGGRSASPSASATPSASPRPSTTASPSASPTATSTARPTATSTAGSCDVTPTVTLNPSTIIATGSAGVTVNAPANRRIQLLAYSQPDRTYRVVREATIDASGNPAQFRVTPPTNTRLYAQIVGCTTDEPRFSRVLNVRTQLSMNVVRNGKQDYTFSGNAIPARPRGLIVSLYRVTSDGRQILTAQTRANANVGQAGYDPSRRAGSYTIRRVFTGTGRFGFVVRTGQDLQNAPGSSNVRSLLVF